MMILIYDCYIFIVQMSNCHIFIVQSYFYRTVVMVIVIYNCHILIVEATSIVLSFYKQILLMLLPSDTFTEKLFLIIINVPLQ